MISDDDSGNGAHRIAKAFVTARREGRALSDYPGQLPQDLAQGYAIQDAAIALMGQPIGGWKVGRVNPPVANVERLVGPIFANRIFVGANKPIEMTLFSGGFGAGEAEFLLRVGQRPPAGKMQFTREDTKALIDAVHVGVEVAGSPFAGISRHGAPVTISDFGNNNGLVIGAPIPDWRDEQFETWPVELSINGSAVGRGKAVDMLDGAIGAARFLFGALAARGIDCEPGQWISSGAVTGVHPVKAGDALEASFNGQLRVTCTFALPDGQICL